jgi:uncharacterized membrane protein
MRRRGVLVAEGTPLKARISFPQDWLQRICLFTLILGIFFRFTHLDQQLYWHDETYTSLRLSGYSAIEVNQDLFDGDVIGAEAFQKYQRPNSQKSVVDTIRTLAIDDSQHPPLYYVLLRWWTQGVGTSITAIRSFSALLSLMLFPALYWLCQELFGYSRSPEKAFLASPAFGQRIAWLAIAITAISPFHLLYAQEAREYSLWGGLIVLWSAAFLRAIRCQTIAAWSLSTVLLVLCLYTQPVTLFIMVGYAAYLLITQRFRVNQTTISGCLSFSAGLLAFSPWLWILMQSWSRTGANWTAVPLPLDILLKTWGLHLERAFVITEGDFGFDTSLVYLTLPLFLTLVSYGFYQLWRQTPLRVWLFVLILTGIVFLVLALPDLILGGQRSTSSRYLVPFYIGVPIAIAYLLSTATLPNLSFVSKTLWKAITAILLSLELCFCILNTQTDTVWTKGINYNLGSVAKILNASPNALLVSHSFGINFGSLFALSYQTSPTVKYQLVDGWFTPDYQNVPKIPQGFRDVYLFNPSDRFRQQIERQENKKSELLFKDFHLFLWHLKNQSS